MTFDAATAHPTDSPAALEIPPADRASFLLLVERSHQIITREQRPEGCYPAAPTFSAYAGYSWLRDSSFIAEGISRYGDVASADRFCDWAGRVLAERRDQVREIVSAATRGDVAAQARMLPTRFTYAGAEGSEPWWDFQTDGYGMWLWATVAHADRHGLDIERWRAGLEVAVDYLGATWDLPCYDWWEEHAEQRHVSTLGAIYGGLTSIATQGLLDSARTTRALDVAGRIQSLVAADGVAEGHLTKWLGNPAVDGSLLSCIVPFGLVARKDPVARATIDAVARDLDIDGGVHRFRADVFYGGGQWLLLSALLGWNLCASGDRAGALRHLKWITAQADDEGNLPEQAAGHLLAPQARSEWVARWGEVARPLLWSHGMYLILADELGLTGAQQVAP